MSSYQPILPDELSAMGFKNNFINAHYAGVAYPWDEKTPKQHYIVSIPGIQKSFDYYCKTKPVYGSKKPVEKQGFDTSEALSFLGCIFGDAECGDMHFSDFCFDFGYDEDSRKAFQTWEACAETGRKLRALFSRSQMESILEYLREAGY